MSAVKKKRDTDAAFSTLADKLEATQDAHVSEFLTTFRAALEAFAVKHKRRIRDDPLFRSRFTEMCYEIGVDPLRSSKGFWTEVLGVGDFFYELGIKIVEVCASTRAANGGLMSLEELEFHLNRDAHDRITQDDIRRAIAKLDVLGDGFRIVNETMVLSVPVELGTDQTVALELARGNAGCVTDAQLRARLGCSAQRAAEVFSQLLKDGFAWLDDAGVPKEPTYYFPSIWLECATASSS